MQQTGLEGPEAGSNMCCLCTSRHNEEKEQILDTCQRQNPEELLTDRIQEWLG